MKSKPASRRTGVILLAFICAVLVCAAFFLIPRHASPEYPVASYEALAGKLRGLCPLPEKEALPEGQGHYFVIAASRFTNRAVGYLMGFSPADGSAAELTITCKSLEALPAESRSIAATERYREVGLHAGDGHLCFILAGFRYDIHGREAGEGFAQSARALARSIIDAGLPEAA